MKSHVVCPQAQPHSQGLFTTSDFPSFTSQMLDYRSVSPCHLWGAGDQAQGYVCWVSMLSTESHLSPISISVCH